MSIKYFKYIIFLLLISIVRSKNDASYFYLEGVNAYLENRFEDCVVLLENATKYYKTYTKKLSNCRIKCNQKSQSSKPLYSYNIDDLLTYERAIKNTLCLMKCKKTYNLNQIDPEIKILIENKKQYEYLHICYFQTKEYAKAVSSLYTYLLSHPIQPVLEKTLQYYLTLEGVDNNAIVNLEALPYENFYRLALEAYDEERWEQVIKYMEQSLKEFLQFEEECRVLCEDPLDPGWFPDFIPAISNHFTYCLRCKQKCRDKSGRNADEIIASHYHYLQYAYFKRKNMYDACQAALSYLLFFPHDEVMSDNLSHYTDFDNYKMNPRMEALRYYHRNKYETSILKYVDSNFGNGSEGVGDLDEMNNDEKGIKKGVSVTWLEEITKDNLGICPV